MSLRSRDAYWRDASRFLKIYATALVASFFLLRWAALEPNETIKDGMLIVPGLTVFSSGFVGAACCEIYFTMEGFRKNYLNADSYRPRHYDYLKFASGVAVFAIVGIVMWLVVRAGR